MMPPSAGGGIPMVTGKSIAAIVVGSLIAMGALAWYRSGGPAVPPAADRLILFSIDGNDYEPGTEPKAAETFHRYPVLGSVEITDPATKKEILDALHEGLARGTQLARCFWPRHGVRVVRDGETVDSVICFECGHHEIHQGGDRKVMPTTSTPQAVLNRHLTAAGIPLAPGMKPD